MMRFGLKLSQHAPIETYRKVWQIADDGGFEHCWVMDHFATIGGPDDGPIFEGWTMLGAMALATSRVRVGCMVTGNTYRHPAVLAKEAVTVDQLSSGRLEFGIGAAWAENEHQMLGLQFGTLGERMDRLEEACQVIRSLWTEPRTTFKGVHYQLQDAVAEPKPLQRPGPPVWIGGRGRVRTLRIVARYADVWNLAGGSVADFTELSGVLDRHCTEVGRDPAAIRRTVQLRAPQPDDRLAALVSEFSAAGADDVIFVLAEPGRAATHAQELAELLPRLRANTGS